LPLPKKKDIEIGIIMDWNFNRRALEEFGKDNRNMPLDAPSKGVDEKEGALVTYLDLRIVKEWTLHYLSCMNLQNLSVLDVGAGKGRMTRYFAQYTDKCVALEPFSEFYTVLDTVCKPYKNVETYNCTFTEYIASSERMFDLIYVSGVTTYFDDEELKLFFRAASGILAPLGLIFVREWGSPSKTEYLSNATNRTRKHTVGTALEAGLECIRWRRAYPPFLFYRLQELWPNRITESLKINAFKPCFFPLWEMLAKMNIPRGDRKCFFVYCFRKATA
jgi:SAM-dependent methyltransferase